MRLLSTDSVSCYGGRDDGWSEAILASCPSLRTGCRPAPWARNAHLQNLLTVAHDGLASAPRWDLDERLVMADGGTISIQWLGLSAPPGTPVVVVLHTICGSGDALRRLVTSLHRDLGWVVAACNRRGHAGLPLTAPQINTMGSTADFRVQLDTIATRRPDAPLYGIGVSAGSGLLVRYLGEERDRARLRAGVALCPAYDVPDAFAFVHPRYDAYLTRKLIGFFLEPHRAMLGAVTGFDAGLRAPSILEFHRRIFPLAGYDSLAAYYHGSDPMAVALDITNPILVINAIDDPVCVEANVHRHLAAMQTLPRMTLAVTRYGSHCGFFDRPLAGGSWAERTIAEYLRTAHQLL